MDRLISRTSVGNYGRPFRKNAIIATFETIAGLYKRQQHITKPVKGSSKPGVAGKGSTTIQFSKNPSTDGKASSFLKTAACYWRGLSEVDEAFRMSIDFSTMSMLDALASCEPGWESGSKEDTSEIVLDLREWENQKNKIAALRKEANLNLQQCVFLFCLREHFAIKEEDMQEALQYTLDLSFAEQIQLRKDSYLKEDDVKLDLKGVNYSHFVCKELQRWVIAYMLLRYEYEGWIRQKEDRGWEKMKAVADRLFRFQCFEEDLWTGVQRSTDLLLADPKFENEAKTPDTSTKMIMESLRSGSKIPVVEAIRYLSENVCMNVIVFF
ncbi:hypothetical protein BJ508DRAFT_336797 [Ascobolus immersus RN42]|uniref:Uncharacterized protein n=1 Tax=Ascobolus immersus RN42 TaxID=1160509 RepID=A0A3N4HA45_ASCIM|nr:hypothetical protein BJ508DRAFT_336797 [Ascobolus immersus RN42]